MLLNLALHGRILQMDPAKGKMRRTSSSLLLRITDVVLATRQRRV
jgi:hypothetical protein